jgi:hypothetical protein
MAVLSVAALMIATLFAGAALYISLVEHPARLLLSDGQMLAQWQPSYRRALPIQASLAILGGATGFVAWYAGGQWPWLTGAIAMLANWPLTMLVIMPVNRRLMAMLPDKDDREIRSLLLRWGRLHDLRSMLGSLGALLFAWGLLDR